MCFSVDWAMDFGRVPYIPFQSVAEHLGRNLEDRFGVTR